MTLADTVTQTNIVSIKKEYDQKCQKILKQKSIRFAALIDQFGNIVAGDLKNGIQMKLDENQLNDVLCEIASRVSKRKKHDRELGRVKYSASRREDVVIMSFPVHRNAIVIVAEPTMNIDRIAWKIIDILGDQWGTFVGK